MNENRTWSAVGGVGFGDMPSLRALASGCTVFAHWTETNVAQDSLTQYIGLTSGVDNPATTNDCAPSTSCRSTDDNIFRQVRSAGGTARSYVEGARRRCSAEGNAVKHIPEMYYYGGDDHSACQSEVRPLTEFDPNSLPTFALVTPNLCHDGHDCANQSVDRWDQNFLTPLLASTTYRSGSTALFVLWDEDHPVPNLIIAPTAHAGALMSPDASHAAALKTWEEMLGLPVMDQGQLPRAISLRPAAHI